MRRMLFLTALVSQALATARGADVERTTRVFDLRFLERGAEGPGLLPPQPVLRSTSVHAQESTRMVADDGEGGPATGPAAAGSSTSHRSRHCPRISRRT